MAHDECAIGIVEAGAAKLSRRDETGRLVTSLAERSRIVAFRAGRFASVGSSRVSLEESHRVIAG
jgi:hypothetical protein